MKVGFKKQEVRKFRIAVQAARRAFAESKVKDNPFQMEQERNPLMNEELAAKVEEARQKNAAEKHEGYADYA